MRGIDTFRVRWGNATHAPRIRSLLEFSESEIITPNGPQEGTLFSASFQPYVRLFYDEVDSGRWQFFSCVGPTQSGKTLSTYVIPVLWHLFEYRENVVLGIPSMEMAKDKWEQDFYPVLLSSFPESIPTKGRGSRGGLSELVNFEGAGTLKWMSGGGSDKKRAGYTARVIAGTEVDGFDVAGSTSREADKWKQILARSRAYGDQRRSYEECTASTKTGRIWSQYEMGTKSRIVCPCVHCGEYVSPEREHLAGWQGADSEIDAEESSTWVCPECGSAIDDDQRLEMNQNSKLVHRGQTIDCDGRIKGDIPRTRTLSFRWSAFNNRFVSAAQVGAEEWKASQDNDQVNAEKEMRQFVYALPYDPEVEDEVGLSLDAISGRLSTCRQGIVDADRRLVVFVDVGKFQLHWCAVAWSIDTASGVVVDYGTWENKPQQLGAERAIYVGLLELNEELAGLLVDGCGATVAPSVAIVDAGYKPEPVAAFLREVGKPWIASKGFPGDRLAWEKKEVGKKGDHYFLTTEFGGARVHFSADYWKGYLHNRLATPIGEDGALMLYQAEKKRHRQFARHMVSEKEVKEWKGGKSGWVSRWEKIDKANHWLDCAAGCCLGGHMAGVRLVQSQTNNTGSKRRSLRERFKVK